VPGGVQGYDRYAYVNNNPVNGTDPSGHSTWDEGADYTDELKSQDEIWRQTHNHDRCENGNTTYCSYGEQHPVETITFVACGLVLAGAGAAVVGVPTLAEVIAAGEATTVIETYCQGDCSDELNFMGEIFYRFSERSKEFYNGLKEGEDSMSLYRVSDFKSPLDAYKAMAPNGDPSKALYQITNYATAVNNGFLPIYDKIPYGHVSLYADVTITVANSWSKAVPNIFWGPFPVTP